MSHERLQGAQRALPRISHAAAAPTPFRVPDRQLSYVIDKGTPLDSEPGSIERTGNPLDAAIKGDEFFVVQTPAGERYTRNGAFAINAHGELVTSDGHPVLGEGGPITFGPEESGARSPPDGTVDDEPGQARAAPPRAVRRRRNSSRTKAPISSRRRTGRRRPDDARVRGGALERSNVKPVIEMSRLMEVNRLLHEHRQHDRRGSTSCAGPRISQLADLQA